MTPFTYARADDARRGGPAGAARPAAKYLGGGTNLVDLMRETIERPAALVDVTGLSSAIEETRGRRPADRRRGAQHRARRASRGAHALSGAGARDPGRRVGADPQHGDGRRQHPAAHALHLFLRRRRRALQQARARRRAATRSTASTASTPSSAPRPPASRRIRPTCASRSRRSTRWCICTGRTGERTLPLTDLHRLPGDHPEIETDAASPAS